MRAMNAAFAGKSRKSQGASPALFRRILSPNVRELPSNSLTAEKTE
jgi:hypothetical protein